MATAKPSAKPAPAAAPAAEDAEPPKKKSKLILIIIVLVIVLLAAAGGGAAWYFLRAKEVPEAAGKDAKDTKDAKHVDTKPPTFVTLEPFTVNLQPEGTERYLQAGIIYQVADQKTVDAMKTYMPIIRNRILMLLSSKLPSEISTLEGKKKLVADLIAVARESIPGSTPERGIDSAYLSSFVIQ